eukprot:CAMPEP_0113632772 /NCGR_PEP_ID=MMETSP0017_2-20120614/17042_1 /TAXON_ID=2856 /ORGANISM="Cylindrotheca closterium" /LENGTH=337 /DNA_ID=CAMNT_0000543357 /DNA_START=31 /DNA_END=1044 /DNA_ORIENTATION=+ /assembly_acc=CAM_ASM_000147
MTKLMKTGLLAIALLALSLQWKEVSSFSAPVQHQHQRQHRQNQLQTRSVSWNKVGKTSPFTLLPPTTTTTSSTSLCSAAAESPGNHHLHNRQHNNVEQHTNGIKTGINGAPKSNTIPLSTNQGIFFGCILAITSGIINGATLMGLWSNSQGTAALTGTYTKSALFLAKREWKTCLWYFKCLVAWLAGSTLVGLMIPEPSAFEVKYPKGLAACLAIGATCLSFAGFTSGPNFVLLCLAAQGIQDAVSSIMTSNLCRTTHMTGITCDLGTFLGQFLRGNSQVINSTKARAFSLLALSFSAGAFMSFPLSNLFGPRMLLGVAGAYLTMAASIGVDFLRHR